MNKRLRVTDEFFRDLDRLSNSTTRSPETVWKSFVRIVRRVSAGETGTEIPHDSQRLVIDSPIGVLIRKPEEHEVVLLGAFAASLPHPASTQSTVK